MKIRLGFVSNSSSSSFCIRADAYKNTFELAQVMVMCREWNDEGRDDKLISQIAKDAEVMDPDSNIAFVTCNYWTYIRKIDGRYVVQTCNNHAFPEYLEGMVHNWPDSLVERAEREGYGNDLWDYCSMHLADGEVFWFPEFRIWGNELDWNYTGRKDVQCKTHPWATLLWEDRTGNIICASCLE